MLKNKKSPLAHLMSERSEEEDYKRVRKLGFLLEHFHLKHTVVDRIEGRNIVLEGQEVINFGSANYLGLEQHSEVIQSSQKALESWGTHAGCSRIFASHRNMIQLEEEISQLLGAEATLVGHNISQIHAGVIPALFSSNQSVLFVDRFAHTSIYQACLIAVAKGAQIVKIDSENLEETRTLIEQNKKNRNALFVDGVYSMQGHIPALRELSQICEINNTILYVDDAHGIGVYGNRGGGVIEQLGLSYKNLIVVGSLQKAFGCYGGFISANKDVIDFLRSTSKSYIFSGTLQPSAVEGSRAAIRICQSEEGQKLRARLKNISRQIRLELKKLEFQVPEGDSPIIPVFIGNDLKTMMAGRKMYDLGMYLNSVTYPAVPMGQGILRISLTAIHTDEQMKALIAAFVELKKYMQTYQSSLANVAHAGKEIILSKILGDQYGGL